LTFQNHTNRPLTDFGGKTSIFSHPVYLFLREFSLQDFRGGSHLIVVLFDKGFIRQVLDLIYKVSFLSLNSPV
ncbi:hypothetical protein, partial [Escherichia coli]|uniref:hypothetical protein n=1 Tax=Escherichia coli TaxID=562 RepID=UPI001BB2AA4D